jgi:polysaccharide pyruvyl transferase WcaK-like protein
MASGRRRVLILEDQFPFASRLPNVGDRALQSGLRVLCDAWCECDVLSGTWKAFPHLTGERYRREAADPGQILARWYDEAAGYPAWRRAVERRLADLLAGRGFTGGLWSPLDRWSRTRTGLSFVNAIEPRLLRAHEATRLREQIAAADVVLFNAGGLLADHLGRYLPERLFELYLAQRSGKPTAVVNYSAGLDEPSNVALAREVLGRVGLHVTREPLTRDRLLELGVSDDRILVSPDTAFAVDPPPAAPPSSGSVEIALMIRGDRPADVDAWAALVDALRARYRARVHYLCGCAKNDPPLRRALASRCRLDDDGVFLDHPELMRKLARTSLLISDRYHGAVFAIQTHTPLIPVASTTHKSAGLFRTFEYPVPVQRPLDGTLVAAYLHWSDRLLREGDSVSRHLAGVHQRLRARVFADYGELFRRLGLAREASIGS